MNKLLYLPLCLVWIGAHASDNCVKEKECKLECDSDWVECLAYDTSDSACFHVENKCDKVCDHEHQCDDEVVEKPEGI